MVYITTYHEWMWPVRGIARSLADAINTVKDFPWFDIKDCDGVIIASRQSLEETIKYFHQEKDIDIDEP